MVRGFGLELVLGIALSLCCAFTVGAAALALHGRRRAPRAARTPAVLAEALAGAREILRDNALARGARRFAWDQALRRPERMLAVGLGLAVIGWGLDTQTAVQTDVTKLVPANLASLRNLATLERDTGVGGEIDVMVSARSLANARVVRWMSAYERAVLARYGYSESSAARGCGHVQLCPAFSLPDLFSSGGGSAATVTDAAVRGVLAAVPAYLSQGVITPDRRTATLAFGIREMPLARQQQVVQQMRRLLHPPPGVQASLVGLPVLAAQANADVASPSRRLLTLLAGLLAVGIVLLIAFRGDRRRALVPLVPIVLASGWSALVLFCVRIPLNPMSVTMGALVIAISTEFSVLLCERYRFERAGDVAPVDALARTYRRTGAAVGASGATAIAGFAVLVCSDINLLRDFGLVTVIDLSVALAGVLVVLPAVLLLAERQPAWLPGRRRAPSPRHGLGGSARHEPV
jgi:predicted RND superfamily exporter protein